MSLVLMCLEIFFARIIDVSLGTIRTYITIKGKTIIAALIAFVEVTIWFLVVKEAIAADTNFFIVISYASGYTVGTMLGTYISKTFIKGLIRVEIITENATKKNIEFIKKAGYGISVISLKDSKKDLLLIEAQNKELKKIKRIIKDIDENAFVVINESKLVYNGFIK